jgi:integrase/recombinase XerD
MSAEPITTDSQIPAHISANSLLIPTIKAWRFFLEDQRLSPHTVKAFSADLRLLASFLPADRTLSSISTVDLTRFLDWLQSGRGVACSPKSLARRITSIKSFFRWLHEKGVLLIDPAERLPQRSVLSPLPEVLTPEETQAVLDAAQAYRVARKPDPRPLTLVSLLLSTGIKKGECLALSPNHIDLDTPEGPILFVRYASPQNRYKERKISLPAEWVEVYQEYRSHYTISERVFPWSPRRLEYLLEDLGNDAGLKKHLSFDMCRWSCALKDWRAGIDHNKIRQKLGISKVQWREISLKLERLASS